MYRDRFGLSLISRPAMVVRVRLQAVAANVTGDDLRSDGSAGRVHVMQRPTGVGGAEAMPHMLPTG